MATPDRRYAREPFGEALTYLRDKINLDTDSWRDLRDDEHDAFFVVAGAKGSLLSELRTAVDRAIEQGQRPEDFQGTFEKIAEGWDYNGSAGWRSRIILQTNLRASYGRGREEMQLDPEVLRLQPYLQYIHGGSTAPRPHHLALDGQVFTADTLPWALPSGFGCSCRYVSLSSRRLTELGLSPSTLKRGDSVDVLMPDGRTMRPTLRPDDGWDRQPGQARGARRDELIQRVIDRSPPEIARQVRAATADYKPPATATATAKIKQAAVSPPQQAATSVPHKPLMTEAEALEYTKNSVYQYPVYHGTTEAGGRSITTNGVDVTLNGKAVFGQGFYTAKDYDAAKFYADSARDGDAGAIIAMRVQVTNPKIVANRQDWNEYQASIGLDPYDSSTANAARVTAALKERGYDAVEVVDDGYVCVFDAKQVAVFQEERLEPEDDDDFFGDDF